MKLKKMMALALASTALIAAAGCGGNSEPAKSGAASGAKVTGQVTSSGSSALLPLVKDAAAKFKSKESGSIPDTECRRLRHRLEAGR